MESGKLMNNKMRPNQDQGRYFLILLAVGKSKSRRLKVQTAVIYAHEQTDRPH